MCGNTDVGNELQAAELNAYLVVKDSFLVAKTFQKLINVLWPVYLGYGQSCKENRPSPKLLHAISRSFFIRNSKMTPHFLCKELNIIPEDFLVGKFVETFLA